MKRPLIGLAAFAIGAGALTALTAPVSANHSCQKWSSLEAGGFREWGAHCTFIQIHDIMFRVHVEGFNRHTGVWQTFNGPWRDCNHTDSITFTVDDEYTDYRDFFIQSTADTKAGGC